MSSVNVLKTVMQPPSEPAETRHGNDWQSIEGKLGTELPVDYKEFINIYGTGVVDHFLWVLNPFSKNKHLNLLDAGTSQLRALRQLRDDFGEDIPYPFFPDVDGLLPWARTDNGDVIYWSCNGSPSNWRIVVNESRGPRWREFELSTSAFLLEVVTRRLRVDVFPDDFPSNSPEFVSTR
jgi:hypothetical protein